VPKRFGDPILGYLMISAGFKFVWVKRRFFMTIPGMSARRIQDYIGRILDPLYGMNAAPRARGARKGVRSSF
jgi:hypothetical protein